MLQVKNVSKVYEGKMSYRALTDINLDIEKGEFVGVMGPSGSGKTTLLNLIATIDEPTTGNVLIEGHDPYLLKQNALAKFRRRTLGFVFQDFNLLHTLTVKENIVLPLTLDGARVKEMESKAETIAETLGIAHLINRSEPTTGNVLIEGHDPYLLKQNALAKFRRRTLGFVFQDFNLLHTLTVKENIVLPLTLDGARVKEMESKAETIAETLGIAHIMN